MHTGTPSANGLYIFETISIFLIVINQTGSLQYYRHLRLFHGYHKSIRQYAQNTVCHNGLGLLIQNHRAEEESNSSKIEDFRFSPQMYH